MRLLQKRRVGDPVSDRREHGCAKPSRHWGCSKLAAMYWSARVSMNLVAEIARLWWHLPAISLALFVLLVVAGCVEGGPWG